ncbi:MAG: hypothetical protein A2X67_06060 [Ignavibacteria bacterium GWA2_55_11]|nr:MAG: hypothetical protein A2X67_06060 [Ignavibacteria bacterium GWA2_55_11]OGU45218.1 MAG: hypothetical protein A2X68_09220 [Ignavibacteria bacterium GWC2_56_12]OGU73066.1 MAG: hypothetical protein A3H45_02035 [Ignavibacteria bacterium RIFCSPLOWO2_02_FULL_55_14]HAV24300.1 RNA polymerase subunit sigma-24 [Bacteroidota bacterium]
MPSFPTLHVADPGAHDDPAFGDVALAQRGDHAAFERVYRAHIGRVYALCLRFMGNRQLAEELAQDVIVKAWEALGSFRGESAFATWLHRLTVNHVMFTFRTNKRRNDRVQVTDDLDPYDTGGPKNSPEHSLDLEHAISRLPEQARIVFVLHDVEGYRHQEIADMLGVADGTSKSQLHRARRLLRSVLQSYSKGM